MMFTTMLAAAGTLLLAYVVSRVASVPFVRQRVPRGRLLAAAGLLWLLSLLGTYLGHGGEGAVAIALELVTMTWLTTLFLVASCLLAVDVGTAFGWLFPRIAPALRGWAALAGGGLAVIALVQGLRPPVVSDFTVRLAGLPEELDGTVIVGISDLHLGAVLGGSWLAARVAEVQSLRPDLIVLLGDITEGHGPSPRRFLPALRELRAPLGVWAVTGNHDLHGARGSPGGGVSLLEEAGFTVLHDRWAEVRPGLVLAGVDDLTSRRRSGRDAGAVARALAGRPPGATVLLSHTPWQADEAAQAGAGLMLAGHTHDGQVWPFRYLETGLYPLMSGRYEIAGMTAIVCRGTGTWGPRMRLWLPSEILRVTVRGTAAR
jgi:predicted MPP superfamily phosphohydrolase